tara:strand:+ start:574 stop:798 length:225 start_codon:yes stop_codon:yes gene_type:complete
MEKILEKTKGRYYTNKRIRRLIDKILHTNAIMYQNMGLGDDYNKARGKEKINLDAIKYLDYDFYKAICPYGCKE